MPAHAPALVATTSLMEAAGIPASARLALLCLIGVLLVILGSLVAFALLIRRRPGDPAPAEAPAGPTAPGEPGPRVALAPGGAALAAVTSEGLVCPTCRRHYDIALEFCPRDARRLVPPGGRAARASGNLCPACRRGFDPGTRFCPHDASELVPVPVYEATRAEADDGTPTGVMGKICPRCRSRHDLAALFCGLDGSELVAIN